jgi:TM2 domain-containing membrane protein YozV
VAGWYTSPDNSAVNRWWDGAQWTEHAAPKFAAPGTSPQVVYVAARPGEKSTGIAHLFFWLLGGFSAHNFYLGRIGPAIGFLVLYWGGWALSTVGVGLVMLFAAVVWLICDVACIRLYLDAANAKL